jgi:hypothetical protein
MAVKSGVTLGVLVGIGDVLIFQHFVPSAADVRTSEPFDKDIERAERQALMWGALFTLIVAGFAKSAEVFAIGGLALVAVDMGIKHANTISPHNGEVAKASAVSTSFPMPDYSS